jgi:hypothetical protein
MDPYEARARRLMSFGSSSDNETIVYDSTGFGEEEGSRQLHGRAVGEVLIRPSRFDGVA